jgi:hypothetical protein
MGKSTVSSTVLETCQIICKELVQEYMPVPSEAHLKKSYFRFLQMPEFPELFQLH